MASATPSWPAASPSARPRSRRTSGAFSLSSSSGTGSRLSCWLIRPDSWDFTRGRRNESPAFLTFTARQAGGSRYADTGHGMAPGDLDCLVEIRAVEQVEADDYLVSLGEGRA